MNVVKDQRLALIKECLGGQKDYYEIKIVNGLEPAQAEILEVEGCPVSLRQRIHEYTGPYVILRSKLLYCQHVMLLATLEGAREAVEFKSYCTDFFRSIKMDCATESLCVRSSIPRDPSVNSHLYSVEVKICHLLTDKHCLWITPTSKISTLKDKTNREFLFLPFSDQGTSGGISPVFDLKRGRIVVKVIDHTMNTFYEHNSNYDLAQGQEPGVNEYKLVLEKGHSKNVLSVGVRMGTKTVEVKNNGMKQEDEMTLCFIKYEFKEAVSSPMIAPMNMVPMGLNMSPLQAPAISAQETSNLSWLRTPGTQVLNGPSSSLPKLPHEGKMVQGQFSGPDMLFGPEQNSPLFNGLTGNMGRPGMPPMTLTSPNLVGANNLPVYNNTGNMLYNQYASPNFQYMQSPMMGLPSSPLMNPSLGMVGTPAMGMQSMNPLATQFNSISLDSGTQVGGSPILPSLMSAVPPPMSLSSSDQHVRNQGVVQRGRVGSRTRASRGAYDKNDANNITTGNGDEDISRVRQPIADCVGNCRGRVVALAKSQSGSRFVQDKLQDPAYFKLFFMELKDRVADLMMDNFGHYAIEALFATSGDDQRLFLVMNLAPSIAVVSCHKQGSFSIQAMMDTLRSGPEIETLVEALSKHVMQIILNCSGHYVILRFLSKFGYPYTRFVHRALVGHCYDFSTDHYGLRVMKAAVDAGPHAQLTNVFNCIVKHTNTLVENQYGNYIIQHLLDVCPPPITNTIKEKLSGKFVRYSKQKFSSNVVEKVIRHSNKETEKRLNQRGAKKNIVEGSTDGKEKDWREIIVRELCEKADDLISDKYGNYCLQTALQSATNDPELLGELTRAITPHLDSLRENVRAKWNKLLETARVQSNHVSKKSKKAGGFRGRAQRKHKSDPQRGAPRRTQYSG